MGNKKPEKKNRSVMTFVLKVISGLLITVILCMVVAWMTQDIWMTTISDHPSGEEIERIRHEKNQYQY